MAKSTKRSEAWSLFDRIVGQAAPNGQHTVPWIVDADGNQRFKPDFATLERLLGVPLHLKAGTQSGVPALALDVWISYELRRAGFTTNQVWPRPTNPRILPNAAAALVESLPMKLRRDVTERIAKMSSIKGVTAASAPILGKNYFKQVDVIITDWDTGPELLVSTKRMDSSYGKNAANRVEESYGDAKNLRLRHPLAALGFALGLRSDILAKEPEVAEWLFDLLAKLGREDDAYHATCLILMDYADSVAVIEKDVAEPDLGIFAPGLEEAGDEEAEVPAAISMAAVDKAIAGLPKVTILREETPPELAPDRFLAELVSRVLTTTPVNVHTEARRRRATARVSAGSSA